MTTDQVRAAYELHAAAEALLAVLPPNPPPVFQNAAALLAAWSAIFDAEVISSSVPALAAPMLQS
jgi:hypothetical protein